MMQKKIPVFFLIFSLMTGLLAGCGSSTTNDIEDAQFMMDALAFDDAIVLLRQITTKEPTNYRAQALLASALLYKGFIGTSSTYLSLYADFLDGDEANENATGMGWLASIVAGKTASGKDEVIEAINTFENKVQNLTKTDHLQLGFAYLAIFAILGVHVVQPDTPEYDPNALSPEEETIFKNSLDQVEPNMVAGGVDDFGTTGLGQELTAINTALDAAPTIADFFNAQYL
jgi:hypothetical protein